MSPKIMLVAGEVSGDIHAANLVTDLRVLSPGLQVSAVCGERLRAAGVNCLAATEELAHMGLVEVIRELPRIRALMKRLVAHAVQDRPDLAVLVDSPDFNLRLARKLKKIGIPVVLYVSPQLWAWRKGRVRQVRRLAREVLCILPFETDFYGRHQVPARYVGHPLVDDLQREGLLGRAVDRKPGRLALMPGSREMEVRALLPAMLGALRLMPGEVVDDAVLIEAPGIADAVDAVLETTDTDVRLRRVSGESRRRELAGSGLALTASGTATLECALLDVPMIVGYRLKPLSWWLAKLLVNVPHVALVNLILEDEVVPEVLQDRWNPEILAGLAIELMNAGGGKQPAALARVRERLGGPGASMQAAQAVLRHLP
ncbi:MAG: lipid-A-disaccharide synthase [Acidobacteriota bacterium]